MAYMYNNQQSPPIIHDQGGGVGGGGGGWGGLHPTPPVSPYSNPQQQQPIYSLPGSGAPTPVIDAAALTNQLQPAYQAPQFAPPPPAPPKPAGGLLKTLGLFSSRPSYQPHVNTGESSLSAHSGLPNNVVVFVAPQQQQQQQQQQYGTVGNQPVGLGLQSSMSPVAYNQQNHAPPVLPMPAYSPLAAAGQPGQSPVYQPSPAAGSAFQQQQQQQQPHPQHQQPQNKPPQHQQPQHQHQQPQQPQQYPQQQHQQQPQQQQGQHHQQQHPQQQHLQQPQQPQHPQHPQQQQQHQQPYDEAYPTAAAPAPPPAYTQGPAGARNWPEKPTIQSHYASSPAAPAAAPPNNTQPANPHPKPQGQDDTRYWGLLVTQGTIPLAPKPQLRSLFRGIANCIIKECTVDATPSCVLSPSQMSMYYGIHFGYGSRTADLFSRAQTAPHALSTLYARLEVEHVLIPSDPGDGRRKPHMPGLTIRGFEHWLLLTTLMDPDTEHTRLVAFIASPGRRIVDDNGVVFPVGGFPRGALPVAPDPFVCRRYAGFLAQALADEGTAEHDAGWKGEVEDLKKRLFEREAELERSNALVEGLQKQLAIQIAAADAAVTRMSVPLGIHLPDQTQNPQQNQYPPDQKTQQRPYSPYLPQQQQNQYPQPPRSPPQQYQQPPQPQPQRRQSEQIHPQEQRPSQPQRRQTEQSTAPQQQQQQPQPQQQQQPQPQQQQQQPYYRQQYRPAR